MLATSTFTAAKKMLCIPGDGDDGNGIPFQVQQRRAKEMKEANKELRCRI